MKATMMAEVSPSIHELAAAAVGGGGGHEEYTGGGTQQQQQQQHGSCSKRQRRMEAWESSIYSDNVIRTTGSTSDDDDDGEHGDSSGCRKSLGLREIFDGNGQFGGGNGGGFFTMRMEHRKGGMLGQCGNAYRGETERLLLFRSDRPGAIGKVIYSSEPAASSLLSGMKPATQKKRSDVWNREDDADDAAVGVGGGANRDWFQNNYDFDAEQMSHMAQAKIHVLDVKENYRGRDLGGLLFFEAISSLRDQYRDEGDDDDDVVSGDDEETVPPLDNDHDADGNNNNNGNNIAAPMVRLRNHPSVLCQLDAEEDTRRHDKLRHFYEDLGCHVKPRAKIRYLNNNDGETYRKIPMQIAVRGSSSVVGTSGGDGGGGSGRRSRQGAHRKVAAVDPPNEQGGGGGGGGGGSNLDHEELGSTLVTTTKGRKVDDEKKIEQRVFLPIQLLEKDGTKVRVSTRSTVNGGMNMYGRERRLDWIMTESPKYEGVRFQTTQGRLLCAEPDGKVVADRAVPMSWECFRVRRVPDADEWDAEDGYSTSTGEGGEGGNDSIRRKKLFTIQTSHGTFLTIDPVTHALSCSEYPVFWVADEAGLTLSCTLDTPLRRQHYKRTWTQGVNVVRCMREKFSKFELERMSVKEALDLVKKVPCHRFHVNGVVPSLRSYLFNAAELARAEGYPDWVQLIALVHGLARVLTATRQGATSRTYVNGEYDWTLTARSRVVGCAAPPRVIFHEYRGLDPDLRTDQYRTDVGMYHAGCGLSNVLLTWTGPEYVHLMLQENGVSIPEDGYAMLRLFPLSDWHLANEYGQLTDGYDEDVRPFVSEFDDLVRRAKRENLRELSDRDCDRLWEDHYVVIFEKYNCGGTLRW